MKTKKENENLISPYNFTELFFIWCSVNASHLNWKSHFIVFKNLRKQKNDCYEKQQHRN